LEEIQKLKESLVDKDILQRKIKDLEEMEIFYKDIGE